MDNSIWRVLFCLGDGALALLLVISLVAAKFFDQPPTWAPWVLGALIAAVIAGYAFSTLGRLIKFAERPGD